MWHSGKEPAWPMQETHETQARSLGGEDPLEEETPPYSSILAWRMPWTEKPRGLQSMVAWALSQPLRAGLGPEKRLSRMAGRLLGWAPSTSR